MFRDLPLAWILPILLVVLVFLPAKYDPAIRLKEWLDRKSEDR